MKLTGEQQRLLDLARTEEGAHLSEARRAVLREFGKVDLKRVEKAMQAALTLPASRRPAALKGVRLLIEEAAPHLRTPPGSLLALMRRAVKDRVLSARDLAELADPRLIFGDTRELEADTVRRQRAHMNRYWRGEDRRFRDDVARTVREALRRGLSPEQAADLLQERLGVHRSRAVLIAQDQLLTAGAVAERRVLQAAGVRRFMWVSLMDGRQRKSHELLHGRVFTWRSAPELPGQAIRCRCRASAVPDVSPAAAP